MNDVEVWKDIQGYEGLYQVSNLGKVRSLISNKILRTCTHKRGYLMVALCKNKKKKNYYVHRLVANAYILKESNKNEVNHIDGNKTNNNSSNLEWCSDAENREHAYNTGLRKSETIVEVEMFSISGEFISRFDSMCEASKVTGIRMGNISRCCNGHCNSAGGYIFKKVGGVE